MYVVSDGGLKDYIKTSDRVTAVHSCAILKKEFNSAQRYPGETRVSP